MEENEYQKIIKNIEKEKDYEWKKGILYRKMKGKRLQIIRKWEMEGILLSYNSSTFRDKSNI